MFYSDSPTEIRKPFFESWKKYRARLPLLPLEQQIADVILAHPEYHALLENPENEVHLDLPADTPNPFLHMGLHLAIRDQVATNRPAGIAAVWKALLTRTGDALAAEHCMMESLAECLWQAQRDNAPPDEARYLEALRALAR
ncbi:hypothetical protein Lgee_1891 [Legionella geestiana]|uniref:Uncharacterized protein n=1 Tax=Legionella geestiana TaxID=45065 RepID=A0A0W0TNP6_9GAMM|nr:DUF1841 family protein [Legionella geestiana]KTC97230.1 hypothetical protein Lgee_1891 [Legionella geestiana]QBS12362.1 DUF1841 family protein [Legionella geestiana]QDQ39925.1 DUF1841 family protein [Legionella geestiana]STX55199.1 Domain of uncharacterised function (DUF1841) [Legionella geestiana]